MARLRRASRLVRLDLVPGLGEDLAALPGAHPLPPGDAEPGAVIAAARAAGRAAALAGVGKADAPARRLDRELADLVADAGRAAIHQRAALGPGDAGQLAHVAVEEMERDVEIGRTLVEPHELQHIGRRVLRSGRIAVRHALAIDALEPGEVDRAVAGERGRRPESREREREDEAAPQGFAFCRRASSASTASLYSADALRRAGSAILRRAAGLKDDWLYQPRAPQLSFAQRPPTSSNRMRPPPGTRRSTQAWSGPPVSSR